MSVFAQSKPALDEMQLPAASSTKSSYGQILKSSAIIGGSSVITVAFGIVRTKVLALLLGPSGVGLIGLYSSIADLTRNVAGMGINSSGVRQIAESVGSGDAHQIARTVITLRRVALLLGIAGALALFALSKPIAKFTFGDSQRAGSVALLSLVVLFGTLSAGQAALVQGMRRIGDLARLSVVGAFFGTVFSIPVVYYFRELGIALFLVVVAGMGILTSWWYARKIKLERDIMPWSEVSAEASALLKLGFVFMASGLMSLGTAYLIRVFLLRKIGVDAAGFYQAAFALAGVYVSFILQAMGADFFPRLTAVAKDNAACNRMVNEQTEVGLLIAVPGILGTLTCAPLVIHLFYSARFEPAVELLRWNCLGMLLRVASWPMGFIIIAKGERGFFMLTESLSWLAYLALVWAGVSVFGLVGAGMAFFGMYLFCWFLVFIVVRRLSCFRWSAGSIRLGLILVPLVAIVFISGCFLPRYWSLVLGIVTTLSASYYSLKTVSTLVALERLPDLIRKLLVLLKIRPPANHV